MAKKTYKIPHTQIANAVLLNLARVKLTKVAYYRFLMILFRETFGRKRQQGHELGKYMEWTTKPFMENGIERNEVSRVKRELLALKVIRKKQGKVGFNWHFNQWKTEWHVGSAAYRPTSLQEQAQQPIPVGSAAYKTGSKPATGEDSQLVKKQKETKKLYSADFLRFWERYPKKKDKQRAAITFQQKTKETNISTVLKALDTYMEEVPRLVENAIRQGHSYKYQFVKDPQTWLNSKPWDDGTSQRLESVHRPKTLEEKLTMAKAEFEKGNITREQYEKFIKQVQEKEKQYG